MVPLRILASAGEASGDLYCAGLVEELGRRLPGTEFFGCAGPRMRAAGVREVVDAGSLSVVGLVEIVKHIPRIYREFRRMVEVARSERPDLAILTDSPDFHLRLAARIKALGVPIVYLVAPQAWAWRSGRVRQLRCNTDRLLCIFPFEEDFFRSRGVSAEYIGHPLARLAKPSTSKAEFFSKHGLPEDTRIVCLLPGSRQGEALRHIPGLLDAVARLQHWPSVRFLLALPAGFWAGREAELERHIGELPIKIVIGETWDAIAHAELALAASGTVTIEAALLGTPMVTFYKVSNASWLLGRRLVKVPFLSMVNLVAGRAIVAELMQNEMRGDRLAAEAARLLEDEAARKQMRKDLSEVAAKLTGPEDPIQRAATVVERLLTVNQGVTHGA